MLKLSHENFLKAKEYIFDYGEDIDRAWFKYIFDGRDADAFLNILSKYQYDNGGFGGLYNEFEYQGPCLKSTEIAITYILSMDIKPDANHPLIKKVMTYLLNNYIPDFGNWCEVVVPEVNDYVHCYWTRYRGEDNSPILDEEERISRYRANEKVCFAGFVSYYSEIVPSDMLESIINYPARHILKYWDVNSPDYRKSIFESKEPYDFEYFMWYVPYLKDTELKNKLTSILCQNPTAFMELDFEKSRYNYVHLPCDSISSPNDYVYTVTKELVDESLEYRMKQQSDDGRWPLGWCLGEEPEFKKLQIKYEAYLTLKMLVKLNAFKMIEL